MRSSFAEKQHAPLWLDRQNSEMSLVLAFERAGYSRDQARRMAEQHRIGAPLLTNHNGGPLLDAE